MIILSSAVNRSSCRQISWYKNIDGTDLIKTVSILEGENLVPPVIHVQRIQLSREHFDNERSPLGIDRKISSNVQGANMR